MGNQYGDGYNSRYSGMVLLSICSCPKPQDDFGVITTAKQNSDSRTNKFLESLERLKGFDLGGLMKAWTI